jgi:signal transduction histidine kinase
MTGREPIEHLGAALERIAEAEDRLKSLQAELEHAQRLATLGVLAAGVAHEINNIITPAMAYAQLAQQRRGDLDLQAKAVDRSAQAMDGCSRIVSAILSFSAVEDEPPAAHLNTALDNALACLARDLAKDGIEFAPTIDDALHARIGPIELQQVLLNLILNARRSLLTTSGHGRRIRISAVPDQAGDVLLLQLEDNGPGVPEEIVERLFEPFVRSDQGEDAKEQGGSGLGLAITRRLVERAGGAIRHERPEQGGARFVLTLPAAPASQYAKAG